MDAARLGAIHQRRSITAVLLTKGIVFDHKCDRLLVGLEAKFLDGSVGRRWMSPHIGQFLNVYVAYTT
jgi:hypothetical protein